MSDLWYRPLAEGLLSEIVTSGKLLSESTAEAILKIPRHVFLSKVFVMTEGESPEWFPYNLDYERELDRRLAYRDESLVVQTRNGVPSITCTAPGVIVKSVEALQMQEGVKVLEIGAGTGYSAALMAEIVRDPSLVTSIEIDCDFANQAKKSLDAAGLNRVTVVEGDGANGYEPNAPYQKIVVNSSCRHIPKNWLDQLDPAGTLLCIRKDSHTQQLLRLERKNELLAGPSLGYAAYPELFRTKNEAVALLDFPDPIINLPLDSFVQMSEVQRASFQLLKNDDFRFYFQLSRPNLHVLDMIVGDSLGDDSWRPVIIDAATNETIFCGPTHDDGEHSFESFGDRETLTLFLSECEEWTELGRPCISDYWFTASAMDHGLLQEMSQMRNSKSRWHLPSRDPDYLDWVIELNE